MPRLSPDDIARIQIKRWMHASGYSQVAIAKAIDKDPSWLSRYLIGDKDADLATLDALARVFAHSITELFTATSEAPDDREMRLVVNYRACTPRARQTLLAVSEALSAPARRRRDPPPHAQAG